MVTKTLQFQLQTDKVAPSSENVYVCNQVLIEDKSHLRKYAFRVYTSATLTVQKII